MGGPAPNPYALNGGGVWPIGGNVEQQQYSYQHMPQFPHQQQQPYFHSPQQAQIVMKKRPITANRLRNNMLGLSKKQTYFPAQNKNQSSIDLEVSRMRPKNIKQERERLYDDALRQKMISNLLKDENVKLKTKI